jgi:hypothetical protein
MSREGFKAESWDNEKASNMVQIWVSICRESLNDVSRLDLGMIRDPQPQSQSNYSLEKVSKQSLGIMRKPQTWFKNWVSICQESLNDVSRLDLGMTR